MHAAGTATVYKLKRARQIVRLEVSSVRSNPYQPRRTFSEESIADLADSIRRYGLLSPIIVRVASDGAYELIAGERRLRALKMLKEETVDSLVLPVQDRDSALLALIENIQREELNCFEEAEAYQTLIRAHGYTQEELARRIGRSQSMIANRIRLLKLAPAVRLQVLECGLSERHARALLRLTDPQAQQLAISRAATEQMGVRQFEALIARMLTAPKKTRSMKLLLRDNRIFINAVLDTVKRISAAGVPATSKIVECPDRIEVIVTLPRVNAIK